MSERIPSRQSPTVACADGEHPAWQLMHRHGRLSLTAFAALVRRVRRGRADELARERLLATFVPLLYQIVVAHRQEASLEDAWGAAVMAFFDVIDDRAIAGVPNTLYSAINTAATRAVERERAQLRAPVQIPATTSARTRQIARRLRPIERLGTADVLAILSHGVTRRTYQEIRALEVAGPGALLASGEDRLRDPPSGGAEVDPWANLPASIDMREARPTEDPYGVTTKQLVDALEQLPLGERVAVIEAYGLFGVPVRRRVGLSAAVRKRKSRAIARLRTLLAPAGGAGEGGARVDEHVRPWKEMPASAAAVYRAERRDALARTAANAATAILTFATDYQWTPEAAYSAARRFARERTGVERSALATAVIAHLDAHFASRCPPGPPAATATGEASGADRRRIPPTSDRTCSRKAS